MSEHVNEEKRSFGISGRIFHTHGQVAACHKCGRKLLVEGVMSDERFAPTLTACCLECVEPSDGFRNQNPETAAALDRWKSEA